MNVLKQLWNYGKLGYQLNSLHSQYTVRNSIDTVECHALIDSIHKQILVCGAICIKFAQWLLPILDNIYIEESSKPYWFTSLEELYENCPIHSTEHSKQIYYEYFHQNFDDNYKIVDVIGSGSIGQVYKIKHKHSEEEFAFKIIHPNVKHELKLFKKILKLCLKFSCLRKKLHDLVPVNYLQFVDNFEEQVDMNKEANNLLQFKYAYRKNPSVIIPELIKSSGSCLIMSYEDGEIMDKMDLTQYQKTKIVSLLFGFVATSQLFCDLIHNDIHKANWKVRQIDENRYSIVVYDFGFCYQKRYKDRQIIRIINDMFEIEDENTDNTANYIKMLQFFINDYTNELKKKIANILPGNLKANPNDIFDLTIKVCNETNTIMDATAIQILITLIQTYKYYKDAGINNGNNLKNDGYRMYRERYFDLINLYETYDSFHTYREYMKTKLNKLNIEISGLFDVVKDNDTVTDEIRGLLTFD